MGRPLRDPDPRAQTTYSAYSQRTPGATTTSGAPSVLPKFDTVRIERAGDQRWLVGKASRQGWPVVREFWVEAGYPLVREQPDVGILETEWYEDRAKIRRTSSAAPSAACSTRCGSTPAATNSARRLRRARSPAPPRSS
jgi:outer membrane protein assembly factor BamC